MLPLLWQLQMVSPLWFDSRIRLSQLNSVGKFTDTGSGIDKITFYPVTRYSTCSTSSPHSTRNDYLRIARFSVKNTVFLETIFSRNFVVFDTKSSSMKLAKHWVSEYWITAWLLLSVGNQERISRKLKTSLTLLEDLTVFLLGRISKD